MHMAVLSMSSQRASRQQGCLSPAVHAQNLLRQAQRTGLWSAEQHKSDTHSYALLVWAVKRLSLQQPSTSGGGGGVREGASQQHDQTYTSIVSYISYPPSSQLPL